MHYTSSSCTALSSPAYSACNELCNLCVHVTSCFVVHVFLCQPKRVPDRTTPVQHRWRNLSKDVYNQTVNEIDPWYCFMNTGKDNAGCDAPDDYIESAEQSMEII